LFTGNQSEQDSSELPKPKRILRVVYQVIKTGLTVRKLQIVGIGEVFFLDILFYRTKILKAA